MVEVKLQVSGMHCASCPILIDDFMMDVPGVTDSKTDLRSGICTVSAADDVITQDLLDAVVAAGYSATVSEKGF